MKISRCGEPNEWIEKCFCVGNQRDGGQGDYAHQICEIAEGGLAQNQIDERLAFWGEFPKAVFNGPGIFWIFRLLLTPSTSSGSLGVAQDEQCVRNVVEPKTVFAT